MDHQGWTLFLDAAMLQWTGLAVLPFLIAALAFAWIGRTPARETIQVVVLLISIGILGGVVGFSGGMSREAAVAAVIPAALTLVGGVALYIFGADMSRGAIVSIAAGCFALSLFFNYAAASQLRTLGSDYRELRDKCFAAYADGELMGSDSGAARFEAAFGKMCASVTGQSGPAAS